jgi:hypothetical protein
MGPAWRQAQYHRPGLTVTLLISQSLGSTRGSAGIGIAFDRESRSVAAHDARVEPEHDGKTHVSSTSPAVRTDPDRHTRRASTILFEFVPALLFATPQQFAVLVKDCRLTMTPDTANGRPAIASIT